MADVDLGTQVEQCAERQIHTHLSGIEFGEEGRTPRVCTVLTKWAQVWLGLVAFPFLTLLVQSALGASAFVLCTLSFNPRSAMR